MKLADLTGKTNYFEDFQIGDVIRHARGILHSQFRHYRCSAHNCRWCLRPSVVRRPRANKKLTAPPELRVTARASKPSDERMQAMFLPELIKMADKLKSIT